MLAQWCTNVAKVSDAVLLTSFCWCDIVVAIWKISSLNDSGRTLVYFTMTWELRDAMHGQQHEDGKNIILPESRERHVPMKDIMKDIILPVVWRRFIPYRWYEGDATPWRELYHSSGMRVMRPREQNYTIAEVWGRRDPVNRIIL